MDHLSRMGIIQEYEINASGRTPVTYYSSLVYNRTDGVFYGRYEQDFGRLNADYKLTNTRNWSKGKLSYIKGSDVPMQSLYYSILFCSMMILPWTPAYNDQVS